MTKKVRECRIHLKSQTQALLILQLRLLKSTSSCLHYYLYGVVDFKILTWWGINEATVMACLCEKSRNKNVSPPNVYEFAKNKLEHFIKQQRQAMNSDKVLHSKEQRANPVNRINFFYGSGMFLFNFCMIENVLFELILCTQESKFWTKETSTACFM